MSNLALVASDAATPWAHDIRNTLATVGLHIDALERHAGDAGRRSIEAAHALMLRATAMCDLAFAQRPSTPRRPVVDVVATMRQVAEVLDPIAPDGFAINIRAHGPIPVIADPEQLFRVIFNLLHNAVGVARRCGTLKTVQVSAERTGATVTIRVADDGPGLPARVRRHLFRPTASSTGGSGLGLTIARELAEKNGATLALAKSHKGTAFVLELAAAPPAAATPVMRSLGRRAA